MIKEMIAGHKAARGEALMHSTGRLEEAIGLHSKHVKVFNGEFNRANMRAATITIKHDDRSIYHFTDVAKRYLQIYVIHRGLTFSIRTPDCMSPENRDYFIDRFDKLCMIEKGILDQSANPDGVCDEVPQVQTSPTGLDSLRERMSVERIPTF